jgi:asparagine synthase (glutamine-hydrolysing)
MCGIVGYTNVRKTDAADPAILAAMCQTIIHRGPDDQGIYTHKQTGLGMRRLSIIDLHTGHQPISNETKSIWVVLNGEIYNYRELATWLVSRGHCLSTSSDTEVIVHLYEEFGEDCVHKLRGMFAFAIWDQSRGRLFIARDRLGVKPLYYYWNGQLLVFGSELKAVLEHPGVERRLDTQGLLYYLRYSYIPDPLTIFQGIAKLPPGHVLSLTGQAVTVRPYWDGAAPPVGGSPPITEEDAMSGLERCLQESVRLRLVSDVPIGAFLSGGIDSSLVVALMARQMDRPVKTFSIGFEEEAYNELPYARRVAQHLKTDHHELIVGPQECDLIERIVGHFDEPFGDPSAIPTYYLSKLAAEHVTVSLSGDGGDELFAGYDRYRVDLARSRFDTFPAVARNMLALASGVLPNEFYGKRFLHNVSLTARQRYLENISYINPMSFVSLLMPELYAESSKIGYADGLMEDHFEKVTGRPWLSQIQYLDTKTYLPGDVLTKVDRMSMAHSLEAREPLLDHVLVEYVAKLPPEMKFRNGVSKYLLKQLAAKLLPHDIIHRKKQGFGVPLEYWFKGGLRTYVHDVLFDSRTRGRGIFQPTAVRNLVRRYEQGEGELASVIWMLVVLETWFRLYLDGVGGVSPEACSAFGRMAGMSSTEKH